MPGRAVADEQAPAKHDPDAGAGGGAAAQPGTTPPETEGPEWPSGILQYAIAAAIGAIALALPTFLLPPNHDASWLLYVGRRLLNGDRMFVDVVDYDPPLILWISAAVDWLAVHLHVAPIALLYALTSVAALVSAVAAARSVRNWGRSTARIVGAAAALLLVAYPGYDFGQREHLAAILVLPYVLAAGTPAGGGALSGIAAGLGFAIKPHFGIAWLAVEVARRCLGFQAIRRASVALVAVVALYAAIAIAAGPEYFTFARAVLPYYARFDYRGAAMLLQWPVWYVPLACFAGSFLDDSASRRYLWPTQAAAAGFLLAAVAQGKGFTYHYYPAVILATISLVWVLRQQRNVASLIVLLMLPLGIARVAQAWSFVQPQNASVAGVREAVRANGSHAVLALSTRTQAVMQAIDDAGALPVSPYLLLWMIPQFYPAGPPDHYRSRAEMEPFERQMFDAIWTAVGRHPPGLVLFDKPRGGTASASGFRIRDYFAADERFSRLFARCQPLPDVGEFEACAISGQP